MREMKHLQLFSVANPIIFKITSENIDFANNIFKSLEFSAIQIPKDKAVLRNKWTRVGLKTNVNLA